jgi:hypothetical protein
MPSKLTLNLDQLAVDSFDTAAVQPRRGTVFGEQCTCYTNCTCPGCPTCANTCPATCAWTCDDPSCAASCNGTCNEATCNTCGYTCGYTDCDCPISCQATACGHSPCCA